ncbi:unnamed protein product [Cochlearia groenlandica]
MNLANNNQAALALAPPQPPQPHRPSTSCDRHTEERFTGFCPSCLFDRLSILDVTTTKTSVASSSKKPPPLPSSSSSSAAAIKALFKPSSFSSSSLFPELRRTQSFSASKNEAFSVTAFEPQRRSCDVKVRNTLWSLFNEDADHNPHKEEIITADSEIDLERRRRSRNAIVNKSRVIEEEREIECVEDNEEDIKCENFKQPRNVIDEIIEEEEIETETTKVKEEEMETTTTATEKKPNRGSFWTAASVFSKKLQRWRQNQKLKKNRRNGGIGGGSAALPVEKSIGKQLRDTQSEIAEYGYGRRSCDTDPRFSIDAGRFSLDAGRLSIDAAARVSVDDPRYSFDEPRASWDGYMIGRTAAPPRMASMLSVVEDSPVRNHVILSDTQIPVESPSLQTSPQDIVPGGSAQTREYYTDSSSRRRKSLDRCSSTRKMSASVMAEIEELKLSALHTKASPTQNRDTKDSILHSRSHRDDCSAENFDIGVRENLRNVESSKKETKKHKRWSWNIFGLLHKKNMNRYEESNGVDRACSGSWNVDSRKGFDPKMMRSNSSASWRSSGTGGGAVRRNSMDGYVSEKKKKVSNSSSSNGRKIDNGMLKFYLTPSKGRRRGGNDAATTTGQTNRPVARNGMNFY